MRCVMAQGSTNVQYICMDIHTYLIYLGLSGDVHTNLVSLWGGGENGGRVSAGRPACGHDTEIRPEITLLPVLG
jgi:hypothetical protein